MLKVEQRTHLGRTLSNTRNTIEKVGLELTDSMPVERGAIKIRQVIVYSHTWKSSDTVVLKKREQRTNSIAPVSFNSRTRELSINNSDICPISVRCYGVFGDCKIILLHSLLVGQVSNSVGARVNVLQQAFPGESRIHSQYWCWIHLSNMRGPRENECSLWDQESSGAREGNRRTTPLRRCPARMTTLFVSRLL